MGDLADMGEAFEHRHGHDMFMVPDKSLKQQKEGKMEFTKVKADPDRPISVTIVGEQGIGKTRLAAAFPNPIILRTEDGTMSLPDGIAQESPLLTTARDVCLGINAAIAVKSCKTVVIDSITTLDSLIEKEIVETDGRAQSLNQACGGYGAGARVLAGKMRTLREFANKVTESGRHLVFVAHSTVTTIKPIDTEPYNQLTIRMNPGSIPPFTDLVDCVAHMRLDITTEKAGSGTEERIGVSSQNRILICYPSAAIQAKNRLGITEPLPCPEGSNPILDVIQSKSKKKGK